MPHPHSAPTRTLPNNPDLEQLRKQAKELLKQFRAGHPAAVAEVEQLEAAGDPATFALADAQRVLSRAYGFPSWTKLKQHVEGLYAQAFYDAVEAGDVATVRSMAAAQPELVNPGGAEFRGSALHRAVCNRDAEMTRALMELGADARKGYWPYRDATTACAMAADREYDDILAIIHQEEERRRKQQSSPGVTISSHTDQIQKAILEDRCDEAIHILERDLSLVGACNNHGATPLHFAAWAHNPEMVDWLLDRQAPVDAEAPFDVHPRTSSPTHGKGKTPLDYAAIVAGWPAADKYYGWSANNDRFPFLENARIDPARFYQTVQLLRSKGAKLTPRAAVALGDKQAVLRMHRDGRLNNEVHFYRGGLLAIAVRVNRIDMVSLLLDLGLDPDEPTTSQDGELSRGFPLWFAAMCGRHEIVKLLLLRGADVNAIVYASGDPLCNADATRDEKMKAMLIEHGARITVEHIARYGDRKTARAVLDGTITAQSLNVAEPSLTQLAEQMLWAAGGCDPEIVRMCLPYVRRQPDDPWWAYVLMHAALPDSFQSILDHGVDPDVAAEGDPTPLHHLATDYVKDEQRLTFATMLLDAGASLHRRDSLLQSTPLGWACRWGRVKLVELYLARGADPHEPDAPPWARPLAWAAKGEHHDIIELLRPT